MANRLGNQVRGTGEGTGPGPVGLEGHSKDFGFCWFELGDMPGSELCGEVGTALGLCKFTLPAVLGRL